MNLADCQIHLEGFAKPQISGTQSYPLKLLECVCMYVGRRVGSSVGKQDFLSFFFFLWKAGFKKKNSLREQERKREWGGGAEGRNLQADSVLVRNLT